MNSEEHICEFCDTEYLIETEDDDDHARFCPFCGEEALESVELDDDDEWQWDDED